MKKTILTLFLVAISFGAMADWVRLWGNEVLEGYANNDSFRKKGKNVVTQNMFDFKTPWEYDGNEYLSSVALYEFDCVKEKARSLESIFYAENKGSGTIVDSWSSPYPWKAVHPATPLYSFMNYACEKISQQSQGDQQ